MKFDREGFRTLIKDHRLRLGLLVFVTLVCGLLIGTVLPGRGAVSRAIGRDSATPLAIPNPVHLSSEFASIVENVEPAVVNISTTQVHRAPKRPRLPRGFDEGPLGDFWNRFFVFADVGPITDHSIRSGVIVDKKGYILTHDYVVNGATKIQVQLSGQSTKYTAKVVGTDDETDLAVLKISADRELPVAKLAIRMEFELAIWSWPSGARLG